MPIGGEVRAARSVPEPGDLVAREKPRGRRLAYVPQAKQPGLGLIHPDQDDVIVSERRGNPRVVYLLGTPATPDQFSLRLRDEAVSHAVAYARSQRVRAWFDNGDGTFRLLGTFRDTD